MQSLSKNLNKISLLISWGVWLWLCAPNTQAQINLQKEPQSLIPTKTVINPTQAYLEQITIESTPLQLPFFDDFSTYKTNQIDTTLWLRSGVYINNTLCLQPISKNVASFDGLNLRGMPYVFTDAFAEGFADTLTSKTIDLSGLTVADSLYLSFFWQATGLGEEPDDTDSLSVWLKDNTNTWRYVWGKLGGRNVPPNQFSQVLIPIRNNIYLHNQFQFRFMSKGRLSGPYDVWHIDYVYLNTNRRANNFFLKDIACTHNPPFLTKPYTAIPMEQFKANQNLYNRDTLKTEIFNRNNIFNVVAHEGTLRNAYNQTILGNIGNGITLIDANKRFNYSLLHQPNLIPNNLDSLALEYRFVVNGGDNATTIQGYDLRRNDTISSITYLNNYLAYDDGTAEYGAGTNQRMARVAYRFLIPQQDTITDVQMYIMPMEISLLGQTFVLNIWKKLDNKKDSILHRQSVTVTYPTQRNRFFNIKLTKPIIVKDTFYVGWQQNTNDVLTIGFDRNTDSGSEIFFNVLNTWSQNTELKGSFLLRPVFKNAIIAALPQDFKTKENSPLIFPNPVDDELHIHLAGIKKIEIYSILGQLNKQFSFTDEVAQRSVSTKDLPAGVYLLKIMLHNQQVFSQKIMIIH